MYYKPPEPSYRQCRLERKTSSGTTHTTQWLPERFAVVGKYLKLKQSDGSFEDGWQVVFAGELTDPDTVYSYQTQHRSIRDRGNGVPLPHSRWADCCW